MPEHLTGTVERVVHYNDHTGFAVFDLVESGRKRRVVGIAPHLDSGDDVEVTGTAEVDARYGPQFKADVIRPMLPAGREGLMRFLASGRIQGIGKRLAKRLIDAFGEQLPHILEHEPKRVHAVQGVGRKRGERIAASWREQQDVRDLLIFLGEHGVGTARALRVHKRYGAQAIPLVRENPYRLAQEVSGIGFLTADSIARSLGLDTHSPARIGAALQHVLDQSRLSGHCGVPRAELLKTTSELLKLEVAPIEAVLAAGERSAVITETVDGTAVVFTRRMHDAEEYVAARLAGLARKPAGNVPDVAGILAASDLPPLTSEKLDAIRCAFGSRVAVITGGPGVGKTTVVSAVLRIAEELDLECETAAPTGRAAKRLIESTGASARTIHRLLEWSPDANDFTRNEGDPLKCGMVIIDEVSMVDILLFEALLRALGPSTRLLLVGDADQLPSVGPGQVLADVIRSGVVPVVHLKQIFRQAANSSIVLNAHRINEGNEPLFDQREGEFFFFAAAEPEEARDRIIDVVTTRIPNRFGLDPLRDIQVLSPMYKSLAGVDELNAVLQRQLNPASRGEGCIERGEDRFAVGDKVMQTQNNYDKEVFNGDIGFVSQIDQEEEELAINFEGRRVVYSWEEMEQLTLAYATTIHKSQGSEFPAVVIPVVRAHHRMLQRNLLYTAVTRAKQLVVLVGQKDAVRIAVRNAGGSRRWTRLRHALRGDSSVIRDR
jgi:exodeoxyribonuclease V alpha subunit